MAPADDLRARLERNDPLLLDGAVGTELERRGLACALPLWSARALLAGVEVGDPRQSGQELLRDIHGDYASSGAEVLTANSFRTQQRTLARAGLADRSRQLTALAVAVARDACSQADHPIWVAGSAPPLEDCFRPDLVPEETALRVEHAEHAEALADAGADLILVETMNTRREAVAATAAAEATGLPVMTSFVCDRDAKLLSGESLARAAREVAEVGAIAVLVNCLPASDVAASLPALAAVGLRFGASANLGAPGERPDSPRSHPCSPAELVAHANDWLIAGASILGGCCGTTPEHIRALRNRLDGLRLRKKFRG